MKYVISDAVVFPVYPPVAHDGPRGTAEHIGQVQVHWLGGHFIRFEAEVKIAAYFAHFVEGSSFPFGNALEAVQVLRRDDQPHALLRFVADDFLGRQGRISDRQPVQIYLSTGFFDEFRQAIQVATGAVIMNGNNRIFVQLGHGSDGI